MKENKGISLLKAMKNNHRRTELKCLGQRGQTAMELAVFGAVLIFMVGVIIRQAVNNSFQQNQQFKAMRLAMTKSFQYSEGLKGDTGDPKNAQMSSDTDSPLLGKQGYGEDGTASRNFSTVLFIEDRLSPSSDKYGSVDRTPLIYGSSATHSRNLFMPVAYGETYNLPVFDAYINGKHFAFSTARFKSIKVSSQNNKDGSAIKGTTPLKELIFTRVPNHQALKDSNDKDADDDIMVWDEGCGKCFDLDRDGTWDDPDIDVPKKERATFSWQWKRVPLSKIQPDTDKGEEEVDNISVDVDGDLKEERVLGKDGNTLYVIDYQAGDLDFTVNDFDHEQQYLEDCLDEDDLVDGKSEDVVAECVKSGIPQKRRVPGLQRDMFLYSQTKGGTYLRVEEGELYKKSNGIKQFVRSIQKKNRVDFIQREIHLSNNTGRFCVGDGDIKRPADNVEGERNPVEVCCGGGVCKETITNSDGTKEGKKIKGAENCFYQDTEDNTDSTIARTCYDLRKKIIFVRSRIKDEFGHKWIGGIEDVEE